MALFGGLAVAAAAGYLWYRELTAPRGDRAPTAAAARARSRRAPAMTWQIVPRLGPNIAPGLGPVPRTPAAALGDFGATAAVRF